MASNARFHNKYHRRNHHSIPSDGFPDSGADPIASPQEPFRGDFHAIGALSATGNLTIGGNTLIYGNLSALGDFSVVDTIVTVTSALSVINDSTGPALTVQQKGNQPIAIFFDDSNPILQLKNNLRAEFFNSQATNTYALAEGDSTTASGYASHAEGSGTIASGTYSHAEGDSTRARSSYSHAEGSSTIASGQASHAEGYGTEAAGTYSHAEGASNIASGGYSHAEGIGTKASGIASHAAGSYAAAAHDRTWIWKGSTATDVISTTRTDQFLVSAAGGVYVPGNVGIGTDNNTNALTVAGVISASGNLTINGSTILGDNSIDTLTLNGTNVSIPNNLNFDSNTLFIDATNNRVGIGTNTPEQTLHVLKGSAGTVIAETNSIAVFEGNGSNHISILTPDGQTGGVVFGSPTDNFGSYLSWNYDNNALKLATDKASGFIQLLTGDEAEAVRITSSGNVGISATAPAERLTVNGNISANGSLSATTIFTTGYGNVIIDRGNYRRNNDPTIIIGANSDQHLRFRAGGDTSAEIRMTILSSGEVGIGTNIAETAAARLTVSGNISATGSTNTSALSVLRTTAGADAAVTILAGNDSGDAASIFFGNNVAVSGHNRGQIRYYNGGIEAMAFSTSTVEAMRIRAGGQVGLGTTQPAEKLTVNGNISSNGTLFAASLTSRSIDLIHTPNNDGVNPTFRIGECTPGSTTLSAFSGISMSYDEGTNVFGISSVFTPIASVLPALSIDRNNNVGVGVLASSSASAARLTVNGNISALSGVYTIGIQPGVIPAMFRADGIDLLAAVNTRTFVANVPAGMKFSASGFKLIITSTDQSVAFTAGPSIALTNLAGGSNNKLINDVTLSTNYAYAAGNIVNQSGGYGGGGAKRTFSTDSIYVEIVTPDRSGGTVTTMIASIIVMGELFY